MADLEYFLTYYGCNIHCYNNNDCNNCWFKQHVQYELDRMRMQHPDCKSETKINVIW